MQKNPKIYLAIDNCFASKRWTDPEEWMNVIKSLGLNYVEASADNECDPLYLGSEYMKRWSEKVLESSQKTGVIVKNLYSGHGTYATLGLAHTDPDIRKRFLEKWLYPMCDTAVATGAGLGFYCHAFADSVLQDPDFYELYKKTLYNDLGSLAKYAASNGCKYVSCEQMYSPHQIPWTVNGTYEFLKETKKASGENHMYVTVDCGHQSGQRKFLRPTRSQIKNFLSDYKKDIRTTKLWFGSEAAYKLAENSSKECDVDLIEAEMDKHPYMFADNIDGDTYEWLRKFACFSPIIHLQQTNGVKSSHLPFTPEHNESGIIKGDKVIDAIKQSFSQPKDDTLPNEVNEIVLTLEIFSGTADINKDILYKIEQSVKYWREFIPQDGLSLDQL